MRIKTVIDTGAAKKAADPCLQRDVDTLNLQGLLRAVFEVFPAIKNAGSALPTLLGLLAMKGSIDGEFPTLARARDTVRTLLGIHGLYSDLRRSPYSQPASVHGWDANGLVIYVDHYRIELRVEKGGVELELCVEFGDKTHGLMRALVLASESGYKGTWGIRSGHGNAEVVMRGIDNPLSEGDIWEIINYAGSENDAPLKTEEPVMYTSRQDLLDFAGISEK